MRKRKWAISATVGIFITTLSGVAASSISHDDFRKNFLDKIESNLPLNYMETAFRGKFRRVEYIIKIDEKGYVNEITQNSTDFRKDANMKCNAIFFRAVFMEEPFSVSDINKNKEIIVIFPCP